MAFLDFLFRREPNRRSEEPRASRGFGVDELARRLAIDPAHLLAVTAAYHEFRLPKRSGGSRRILAPAPELKKMQRLILRGLLRRLVSHPAATGFERGQSIVTHARLHAGRAVVIHFDIQGFFESTSADRIRRFFLRCGWSDDAADLLTQLTTHEGALPQGAPTSPRLSNLVNFVLDLRLEHLSAQCNARYSRYADDITFSLDQDDPAGIRMILWRTGIIVRQTGYVLHHGKMRIRRRHQQQRVTGLVVNEKVQLPRDVRRRLRAVEHRLRNGARTTLSDAQLAGWRSLRSMVDRQRTL